jgi:hypothetical protein
MVLVECNRQLDPAEYECILLLLHRLVEIPLARIHGIQTEIGTDYPEFACLSVFSASYTDARFVRSYSKDKGPSTVVEDMMLRSFADIPSIV